MDDCACSLWDSSPASLESQGLPRGYCGRCEVCGQPGHVRHFPGASPTSGAWCDRHYRRLAWLHPMGSRGRWLYRAVAVIALAAACWRRYLA